MSIKPPETEKPRILSDTLTGEREERGRTEQLDVYSRLKAHQELVSDYILSDFSRLVKEHRKLVDCGSHLVFHNYYRVNVYLLRNGFFCKQHLLCLPCAFRRSGVYTHTYKLAVKHLLASDSTLLPVLITLTIKDGSDLKERYRHITKSRKALMLRRRMALSSSTTIRIQNPTVFVHVLGGVGSYEFKRGKNSGLWHPHSHEVVLMRQGFFEFVPVWRNGKFVMAPLEFESRLAEEWHMLTGDSYIVEAHLIEADSPQEFHSAVAECFKYALKMNDLVPADQVEAYLALRTCRMIFSYGCLRNVDVPEDESRDESEIDLTDEPWIEEHLSWFKGQYLLRKTLSSDEALFPGIEPRNAPRPKAPPKRGKFSAVTAEQVKDWLADMLDKTPF
jgi:hypothetical protein